MARNDSRSHMIVTEVTDIVKRSKRQNKESEEKNFGGKISLGNHSNDQSKIDFSSQISNRTLKDPVGLERFKPKHMNFGSNQKSPNESCDAIGM